MLCFLFAALIVALDQFFKHWIMRTLDLREIGPEIIPGVLGLTRWENDGAMLNILSGQQWLLAGIAFVAAIVLIMILLRYNEGFWGTLGLAAVLGGTIGNLADRIFNDGKVVDMFRTLFVDFPIFNIADIFITLGFLTFLIHFIALSFKGDRAERAAGDYDDDDYDDDYDEQAYDEFPEIDSIAAGQAEQDIGAGRDSSGRRAAPPPPERAAPPPPARTVAPQQPPATPPPQYAPPAPAPVAPQYAADDYSDYDYDTSDSGDYDSYADISSDSSPTLDELEAELGSLDDYSLDDLLREYGSDGDDDTF